MFASLVIDRTMRELPTGLMSSITEPARACQAQFHGLLLDGGEPAVHAAGVVP